MEPKNTPSGRKPDILKLLNQGDGKLCTERLQLDLTRWRGLLGHLLDRTDDIDPRIAGSLRKLQVSVENWIGVQSFQVAVSCLCGHFSECIR